MTKKDGGLTVWHLTMLALGTVVGGSFFLGSAIAIRSAGPGILISYLIGGALVYLILAALSEMTVADQAPGSFRTYAEQMYGPIMGFVVGWVYWTGLTLAMSSEATAASVFLQTWIPDVSIVAMSTIIIVGITLLNLLGAKLLTSLESGLALIKLSAIGGFILLAVGVIFGWFQGRIPVGLGILQTESLFPGGIAGIAGSMLIVMFTYAGFEVIGLAASEAKNPNKTIPRAILLTVLGLVGLYTLSITLLLPLVPTAEFTETISPFVSALTAAGFTWAAGIMNIILIIAILSTMLAAMFGMGRMIRSLAEEGYAPSWLKEEQDVPKKGILFSGAGMLLGVALANVLPSHVYLFLVSSGGFSLLFAYLIIMATHIRFRRKHGCPPKGVCQLHGYPYTSLIGLIALIAIIVSMPLIPGQSSGLFAGLLLVLFYTLAFFLYSKKTDKKTSLKTLWHPQVEMETGEELVPLNHKSEEEDSPDSKKI